MINKQSFPILKSDRLVLRKIKESDGHSIFFLRTNHLVNQYIERSEDDKTKSLLDAIKFIHQLDQWFKDKLSITWGVAFKDEPEVIGTICLWNFSKDFKEAEIGYDLHPEYHGKGIMSEALKKIVEYGFEDLKLHCIKAFTHKENQPSKKLLEKHGFILDIEKQDENSELLLMFQLYNRLK